MTRALLVRAGLEDELDLSVALNWNENKEKRNET